MFSFKTSLANLPCGEFKFLQSLKVRLAIVCSFCRYVRIKKSNRCLSILAIHDGIGQEGAMLWSVRCGVSITSELFHEVFCHGKVNISIVVISFQVDAAI